MNTSIQQAMNNVQGRIDSGNSLPSLNPQQEQIHAGNMRELILLRSVQSGDFVTLEMEALAKIPSEWVWEGGDTWRGRCQVCKGQSNDGHGSIMVPRRIESLIRHAEGCVLERARRICSGEDT